jgi:hypothetical protein
MFGLAKCEQRDEENELDWKIHRLTDRPSLVIRRSRRSIYKYHINRRREFAADGVPRRNLPAHRSFVVHPHPGSAISNIRFGTFYFGPLRVVHRRSSLEKARKKSGPLYINGSIPMLVIDAPIFLLPKNCNVSLPNIATVFTIKRRCYWRLYSRRLRAMVG